MAYLRGDLSLAARIGSPVRCIIKPDISYWESLAPRMYFKKPELGRTYYVRSHVSPGLNYPATYHRGVLLSELDSKTGRIVPINNPEVTFHGDLHGEPFFAYYCFMVLSRP